MRAAVAAVLSVVIGLAPSPRPSGGDFAHSTKLTGCVATVQPTGPAGEPLSAPYQPGTRAVVRLVGGETNVLWLTAADLNQIEELTFEPNPSFGAPLLVNVDTRGVGFDFAWTVPRLPSLPAPNRDLLWHFPDAIRITLSAPVPNGLLFAPRAEVIDTSASPSPVPPPAAQVVPAPGSQPNAHVVPSPSMERAVNARVVASPTAERAVNVRVVASPTPSSTAGASPSPSAAPSASPSPSPSPSRSPSPSPSAIPATQRYPYPLDLICDRSPRPTPPGAAATAPEPGEGAAATVSPASGEARMLALASQPVTWFGIALLLVGLALLIGVVAARAVRR
ncbi:collagen-binding domain-containing protein [Catellatospora tritici]|uniref:collagen-binding domain-containing protein n=1 Tax=Catellatospora tritici TaxID=2851566 RepID=UPI001C2DE2E8|nr:collagen-binding domain-containing protein [Catellatospora tritici]MBV1849620.1 choice-of-anchor A family protein [Catellatospora tritici]